MNKTITKIALIALAGLLIINGCKKETNTISAAAVTSALITTAVTSINTSTAQSGGNITSDGGNAITSRGVCWSTTTGPTTANSKTTDGAGNGLFMSALTGLTGGTTYYVKAYGTNSAGTTYGNEISFTTPVDKDVYVAGVEYNGTQRVGKVWKNGVGTSLTTGTTNSEGNSVFVLGTDVYVAGMEENSSSVKVAKIWKNGVATSLTNGLNPARATSVYVSGTDVYVAGT